MKTTKHTPGPWYHSVINKEFNIRTKDQVFVISGKSGKGFEETVANAKLIATAPDLLDSCQEYQNLLNMIITDEDLWDLLEKKNMIFAAQASLKMDLNRVEKRIKKATE